MKPRVYIETFGCQMNVADSERAATGLRASGYDLCKSIDEADVVLLNTCSVREKAERKVYTRIGEVRAARPDKRDLLVGVMGCVAQLEGEAVFEHASSVNMVIGTRATDRIPSLIEQARQTQRRVLDLGERGEHDSWDVSPVERHSPHVAFIPIIEGCNKFCSFCIVPYSRGRERSRPATEIVAEAKRLQALGYKEIHLIGQNVNSYRPRVEDGLEGFPGATPFCRLLRESLPPDCRVSSLRPLSHVISTLTLFQLSKKTRISAIGSTCRFSREATAYSSSCVEVTKKVTISNEFNG